MFSISELLGKINEFILNPLIVLMFAVALLVFFWGLVEFIAKAGSDDGRDRGKRNMVWGIIGMFIMVSVYGIINLVINTIGVSPNDVPYISNEL